MTKPANSRCAARWLAVIPAIKRSYAHIVAPGSSEAVFSTWLVVTAARETMVTLSIAPNLTHNIGSRGR
jgi:hypothetical protein